MVDGTKKTDTAKDTSSVAARAGGPLRYIGEVRREAGKVTWPTWKETYLTTIMVFIMVLLTMAFFFAVDKVFSLGSRWLLGI